MSRSLNVQSTGHGAPSIVLVPGFGAHSFFWRKWDPVLSRKHRVHSLDLMGFGAAPAPGLGDYSPPAQALRVAAFVRSIRSEGPTVLIGHSLGAGIALLTALDLIEDDRESLLAGIVIVSGAVYAQSLPRFLALARRPVLGRLLLLSPPPQWAMRRGLRGVVGDPDCVDAEFVRGYRTPLRSFAKRRAALRAARQIELAAAERLSGRLGELALPALLIWGQEDTVVPAEYAERLAKELPKANLVTLPGVGHLPPEEAPRRSLLPVLEFLSSLGPTSSSTTPGPA